MTERAERVERKKRVCESHVEQIQVVMPQHGNSAGRLFGGQLMAWIDMVAGVVSVRHSENKNRTTASVDHLSFERPIYLGDLIILKGHISYVGNTSMEVRVDTFVEEPGKPRELANRAYLTFVSLDDNEHPVRVPRLELETDEERAEWEAGAKRAEARRAHRAALAALKTP